MRYNNNNILIIYIYVIILNSFTSAVQFQSALKLLCWLYKLQLKQWIKIKKNAKKKTRILEPTVCMHDYLSELTWV